MLEEIFLALGTVLSLQTILYASIGVFAGMILAAMPGITGNIGIALLIPFTYYMDPLASIVLLMAIMKGGHFGGTIPGILLNMPGTPASAITSIDGYPLAKAGNAKKALQTALIGSTGGDLFSDIILLLAAPPLAMVALRVGPAQFSMILLFSLSIVGSVAGNDPFKGLISACLGLLLSFVGRDPLTAARRFTFGLLELSDGISLIPLLIGILVLSEIFIQLEKNLKTANLQNKSTFQAGNSLTWDELRGCLKDLLRSSVIGTAIGIIPGIGATVGGYLSYTEAKRSAKDSESFGKGDLRGVISSEAGNNAVNGANLIPLITLGVPGNVAAALIFGAFLIHGMTPGPFLMRDHGQLVYTLILTLILSNLILIGIGSIFIKIAHYVYKIPKMLLFPSILVLSSIGAFSVRRSLFDIYLIFLFGLIGYIFKKIEFPIIPLIITFFLGNMFERNFRLALRLSGGELSIFLTDPISLIFLILTIIMMFVSFFKFKSYKG